MAEILPDGSAWMILLIPMIARWTGQKGGDPARLRAVSSLDTGGGIC